MKQATVTLPSSVHPTVRQAQGKKWWRTERAARKEAAFHAYRALHEYGLVNDNFLPLTRKMELRFTNQETLPSVVEALEQYDPFVDIAHGWNSGKLYETRLHVSRDGSVDEDLAISMILPIPLPMPNPITLYLEVDTTLLLSFDQAVRACDVSEQNVDEMRNITALFLQAPSSRERGPERDFVVLFAPSIPCEHLREWLNQHDGRESSLDIYHQGKVPSSIIRDHGKFTEPRTFVRWVVPEQITKSTPVEVECRPLPRRRNLLQTRAVNTEDGDADVVKKLYTMPASAITVDKLPLQKAVFGLFISAILDRLQASLVAHRLNDTILKAVGFDNINHVITAISTPIAQATTNYQRYEFFGDSVLKFTVSCQLFFNNTKWHEGYLSESRDKLIQNSRLARAALDTGIDAFILTDRFTPRRWTAPMISAKQAQPTKTRQLSTKVLADVIESLIGAAYMDGGIHKAQACLHRFLPEITLFTNDISPAIVPAGKGVSNLINQDRLTTLIEYKFHDPALLTEALTHPSCEYDLSTQSYQRLEFLGDAVLDMVVMAVFTSHPVEMDQGAMTILKHSVVNANLLAFLCMDLVVYEESLETPRFTAEGRRLSDPNSQPEEVHLWQFLRSHGPNIRDAREACVQRYEPLRDQIHHALKHASAYPWELFAKLAADKFFSDIIESVLGAMFVDSGGNLDVCNSFIERLGLLSYVRRVIADGVNVVHPRNIAQAMVKGAGTLVFKRRRVEVKGKPATYRCSAIVNKNEIALVEGFATAEEAEVRVALDVVEYLKDNPLVKGS
jgi:dsRNA-specific ribonuclease